MLGITATVTHHPMTDAHIRVHHFRFMHLLLNVGFFNISPDFERCADVEKEDDVDEVPKVS